MHGLNEPSSTTVVSNTAQQGGKRAWMSPRVEAIKLDTAHNTTQFITHYDGFVYSSDGEA
jgi:hypothetical protein